MPYGFSDDTWLDAKEEARQAMIEAARNESLVSYGELFRLVRSITLEPHDAARVSPFLDQISVGEDEEGRGLLSVVVVHQHGDQQPGPGFFVLARSRGRVGSNEEIWIGELQAVYDEWAD